MGNFVKILGRYWKVTAQGMIPEKRVATIVQCANLWNNGDFGPEVVEPEFTDVDAVDVDGSFRRFNDAEQSEGQGRLPGARSTYDTDLSNKIKTIHQVVLLYFWGGRGGGYRVRIRVPGLSLWSNNFLVLHRFLT